LIHSPNDSELEKAVVKLYLDNRINLVSASAYLDLTLPLVYYRVKGIREDQNGQIKVCNLLFHPYIGIPVKGLLI